MLNVRKNLAVKVETPGGDNPLLFDLVSAGPIFRGIPCGPLAFVGRGGTPPYSFTVTTGSLPTGFPTLPVGGDLTGSTATASGHFAFVVQIADFASNVFSHRFAIDVRGQLVVVADTPTPGEVGVAYTYQFVVEDLSGTRLTSGFSLHSGSSLPSWATLHSNGILDGTPDVDGTTYFTVDATDGTDTISMPCSVTVYEALAASNLDPVDVVIGLHPVIRPAITGGVQPYAITMSGAFPDGLTFDSRTGVITGTQLGSPGGYVSHWIVRDALGAVVSYNIPIRVIFAQQPITFRCNGVDVV